MSPAQLDLLPRRFQLHWHADETLFSLCSRYHRLSGSGHSARTSKRLFGAARAALHTDFPVLLSAFAARTFGELGSAEQILKHHTVIPYYLTFSSATYADEVRRMAIEGGSASTLKIQLDRGSGGLNRQPLKYCRECATTDFKIQGASFWRRADQLTTSLVCPVHGTWLVNRRQFQQKIDFCLPLDTGPLDPLGSGNRIALAERLGECGRGLLALGESHPLDLQQLASAYSAELVAAGLASDDFPDQRAGNDFQSFVESVGGELPAFQWADAGRASTLLRRLVKGPHVRHPAKHVLFIIWLFGTWSRFLARYGEARHLQDHLPPQAEFTRSKDYRLLSQRRRALSGTA